MTQRDLNLDRKKGTSASNLTAKQSMFIEAYLADNDMNAASAARAAGYKGAGAGDRLLQHPKVRAEIGKRLGQRRDKFRVDADTVVQELATIAFLDVGEMFDADGVMLDVHKMPEHVRRAIGSLEVETTEDPDTGEKTTKAKIKMNNKLGALELLAKHLGILNEKLNIHQTAGPDVISEVLRQIDERQSQGGAVIDADFIAARIEGPQA